ncbi:unnamed protein product [Mycena citricolor]|uniref:Uncharacterized protein n=1 Tax=Mycena citricolor TaxID=2018698 RepID=A0AAD2Q1V9_9AGAR|nr:unnamed protein product [Mycena citricolor]
MSSSGYYYYTCQRCPLTNHRNHRVLKRQRVAHQAEIATFKERQNTPDAVLEPTRDSEKIDPAHHVPFLMPVNEVDELVSRLDGIQVTTDAPACPADIEVERLASLLTGLVVMDDGVHPSHQTHSKLFSSRDDFQAAVPDVPTDFLPVSSTEAFSGVEAVLQMPTQALLLRPSAIQAQETNVTLLQEMLQRLRAAHAQLDLQHALDASPNTIGALASAVDTASSVVLEAGRLLSSIKLTGNERPRKSPRNKSRVEGDSNEALAQMVREEATTLDSLIDVVGRLLPPETDEVKHDTEHHFVNPIAKYNVIAQLSILLALICHVVVGISSEPVNLIIAFGKLRPIKPFVFTSFIDYIAAMLTDPEVERMCEKACDDVFAAVREAMSQNADASLAEEHVNNVFEAAFLRSFAGPVPGKLFIQRDGRLRLAFQVMLDFFNPNGTRKQGNHNSIGLLAVVNLNLSEDIRYRPENMWLSIILGPSEPGHDQIDNYFHPLIDKFVIGWERGYRFSRTALHAAGRSVDLALVMNVNDLPATRKAQGMAAHNSHQYCSIYEADADNEQQDDDQDVEMIDAPDPRFVPAVTEEEMHQQLMKVNLQPLRWVVSSLGLDTDASRIASKKVCCDQLLAWVSTCLASFQNSH